MSQSSCPNPLPIDEEEVKVERIKEIEKKAEKFLRNVVFSMRVFEGISGRFDIAFKINRGPIIARIMRKLAKEIEDEEE